MYLWRRAANERWLDQNEVELRSLASHRLAIIERPDRKRSLLEVASNSRPLLQQIEQRFGGRFQKLQRNWLKSYLRRKAKPIRVGKAQLIIPAGAAFGTGEHATTAMSLRLLERISRNFKRGWSLIDLGTGSGVLALAAKRLGAKRAIGIDNDPLAISTAKANAKLNRIRAVRFEVGDVRHWKMPRKNRLRHGAGAQVDIVTANLFSELLIEILPKLTKARWLILSGILREQERDLANALTRNKIAIIEARRRGKWVAVLAASR